MKRMMLVGWALLALVGCEERKVKLCDITTSDCQESIYYADLRVRGDGYDPFGGIPPIRTITEEQYRAELQNETEQAAQTNTPRPWWDNALALLGMMPSAAESDTASIENQVKHVAAYYNPSTRKVTVIAHPPRTDVDPRQTMLDNMVFLAHELIHALQDRELSLKINPESVDDLFVVKAMIEGDATLYEYLFGGEISSTTSSYSDPLAYTTFLRSMYMKPENFAKLGPPFLAALYLVYPLGGIWFSGHYQHGGNSAVRHAYGEAPKRSLDYLLPFGTSAPPTTKNDCKPAIPENRGFGNRGRDTFGAVQFYAYLMGWKVPSDAAVTAASLWRDDRIFVSYNSSTQKTAVAWRIELAQPIAAATLAQITTSNGPRVVQEENVLLISASDDPEVAANWIPSTSCQ
jgi:hypothetical protein